MRQLDIREMTKEQLAEESLIDITYAILTEKKETLTFQEILAEIRELTGMTEKQLEAKLLQFYTDLNIDGRFLAMNENRWGLREWYPVDQIEEETAPVVKVRKKKKKKAYTDDEDEELEEEEEEEEDELYDEDYEELGEDAEEEDDEIEEEDEDITEIDEDLLDPEDDELEIIPDDDIEIDEEEEEEDEELE